MPLGTGLEVDPYGSAQIAGSEPSELTAMLYESNGYVGLGTGLQLGLDGELERNGTFPLNNLEVNPKVQFPKNPEPLTKFTDPVTSKVYEWSRTRWQDGTFRADILETPANEAWEWLPD